eukprot:SAG11_NODE_44492_length_154_cov_109.490909_1_plen_32_part_10
MDCATKTHQLFLSNLLVVLVFLIVLSKALVLA